MAGNIGVELNLAFDEINICDWLWENRHVRTKMNIEKYTILYHYSKCNILRRLKAADLQFAMNVVI